MDLWSTLALLGRRRYLAALLLVITMGGSLAAIASLAPVSEVRSSLVLLLPAGQSPDGNPYTSGFQNQVLARLVATNMSAPAAIGQMSEQGADPRYEVTADNGYTAAFVRVVSRSRDEALAIRTVAVVSEGIRAETAHLQRISGAPEETWVQATPLVAAPEPQILAGSRIRPLAALVLASLLVALGGTFLAEGLYRRRRRTHTGTPHLNAPPPWVGFVNPDEGSGTEPVTRPKFPLDAVDAITVFVALLFILPARLVFAPLGAAGTPANIWGLVLLLWWTAHRLIPRSGQPGGPGAALTFQPVRIAIQVLGLAALISYAGAFFRPIDIVEIAAADRGLIALAAWSGVALVAVDGITTYARLRRLVDRVATAGAALAALGIVQFFTAIDIRPWFHLPFLSVNGDLELILLNSRSGFNRVAGTTNHPIEFSAVLAVILPLALHVAFHANPEKKRMAWIRVLLIGAAVPLSLSRTGMLGLLVGGAILFVSWPAPRRWRAILLTPFLAVGLRLLVPGLLGSIRSLFLSIQSDNSFIGRTDDYEIVARLFSEAPFFGRGWGTLLPDRYVLLDNQLLKTLLEGGLFALVALVGLFAVGIGAARGAYHRAADAEGRDLGQSSAAALAVGLVSFATFDAFAFVTVPATLFLVLGCSGALWRLTLPAASPSEVLVEPTPLRNRTLEPR